MIGEAIDRAIGVFAPYWAANRMAARASLSQMEAFTGQGQGGYDAGKINRLTRNSQGNSFNENAIPRMQIDRLRWASWNLYRNNPHARKIVRTIQSKVSVLHPQSQAKNDDGTPNVEFRAAAQQLLADWCKCCDYRGKPGFGGQSLDSLAKTALASVILGGECLFRLRPVTVDEQEEYGLPVPLQLQLISADRLSETIDKIGTVGCFAGIETDSEGRRTAYHLVPALIGLIAPLAGAIGMETVRVPADEICHLYISEDIDQLRGVPWMAAALSQVRDAGDYQFNELKASALASCVTLGVRRPTGATQFGLAADDGGDLSDTDGNKLTAMQPGMIVDLGTDGALEGFNPNRPSTSAEAFIQHILRSVAAALPGVKASTLTGDYRGSSFSSERSADNDCWPELEDVQDWWGESFYQPIYEAVIEAAIASGYFDDLGITAAEFEDREADFLACDWQGPVPRSINPTDDAAGAKLRIESAISSVPIECAKVGLNWRDVVKSQAEFIEYATALGIPENLVNQFAGLNPKVAVAEVKVDGPPTGPDGTPPVTNGSRFSNGALNGHN
jgi:lambda family phage portal protein